MRKIALGIVFVLGTVGVIAPAQGAESFRDCAECPVMVTVPAGSFMMGSTPAETDSEFRVLMKDDPWEGYGYPPIERPRHPVSVKRFSLGVSEVTRGQFDAFVQATGHQVGRSCWIYKVSDFTFVNSIEHDWRDPGFAQGSNHPVVCVNWNDARAYARWLSQITGKAYRLPSEAEWEYAARARSTTLRHWGDLWHDACRFANVTDTSASMGLGTYKYKEKRFPCADGAVYTSPVSQFLANAFGLHDMIGNVLEWTEDCYQSSYDAAPNDGSAWLAGDCNVRVDRGGSWHSSPWLARSAARSRDGWWNRVSDRGFRVARTDP